jgi:putative endonuclease
VKERRKIGGNNIKSFKNIYIGAIFVKAKRVTGNFGEDAACTILQNKGFRIIDRNYSTRYGELDIIATDGQYLVFVEVKTRVSDVFGTGLESITRSKRKHLSKAALLYAIQKKLKDQPCRFDVISVKLDAEGNVVNYLHIPAAFDFEGGNYF